MGLSDWLQSRRREQGKTRDANVGRSGANGRFYRKPSRYEPGLGTNRAADGQIVGHETRDPDIKRKTDGRFTKDDDSDIMSEIGAGVMESLDPGDSRPTGAALMTEPQSEPQSERRKKMSQEITVTKVEDHYEMQFDGGDAYPVPTNAIDKLDDDLTPEEVDESVTFTGDYGGHKHMKSFDVEEVIETQSEPQSDQPDTGVLSSEIRDPEIGRQTTAEEWGHGVLDLTTGDRR